MVKLQFDFTKNPPHIDIDKSAMNFGDIALLKVAFYQMSLGKKFLKKFTLFASGKDLKITPILDEQILDVSVPQEVFKNLMKDITLAYSDYSK